jgi:hypothetical protein
VKKQSAISRQRSASTGKPKRGGILHALRRSPLVGSDLKIRRPVIPVRAASTAAFESECDSATNQDGAGTAIE